MASMIGDDSRPSKRARFLVEYESSDSAGEDGVVNGDGFLPLKINDDYARRYEHNKKREEQHRLEEKYGDQSKLHDVGSLDPESDSESESEDEGELATDKVDAEILDTLKAIRSKDPRVYDKNAKFFTNDEEEEVKESKVKKVKPIHLRDYHRQKLLGGNQFDDGLQSPSQPKDGGKEDLVRSIHTATLQEDDDPNNDKEEFLQAKMKEEQPHEESPTPAPDVSHAEEDPDKFLTDFVTSRAWAEDSGAGFAPLESDDDEEDARREALEHAYNMRFEDPARANETIMTHSRMATEAQSVRRRDLKGRKRTREMERAEREAELRKEDQEKRRLRALKIDEAQQKLQQFKEAAGMRNKSVTVEEWSKFLNAGWDSNKWDEEMARRFDDQYYEEDESDGNVSDGSQNDGVAKRKHLKKPKWNDDIDIGDIASDFVNEDKAKAFSLSDEDEGKGQDDAEDDVKEAGGVSLEANDVADEHEIIDGDVDTGKSSHQKQSHRQAQQERKKIEDLVDQRMITEGPSKTAKASGPFRYRATSPSNFGLSASEILMADDSQLNQHAGLKKLASFRDPDKKHKDKRKLSKRARLREWRKETFGNEEGPERSFQEHLKSRMEAPHAPKPVQNGAPREEDGEARKKKKRKRSRKRKADQVDEGPATGQDESQ
ncbi:MAG: KRRI-Interacting protein 1 [Alyxoria varia]|nr:MAG: KRRI-Interacting protein 1 [Alyxoria varia]